MTQNIVYFDLSFESVSLKITALCRVSLSMYHRNLLRW